MENIVEGAARKINGREDILIIGSEDHAPIKRLEMEVRWHKSKLIEEYAGMKLFMANKNTHRLEYRMKGAIVWLEGNGIIAMIIAAQGAKAYVEQLYPPPTEDSRFQVTLAQYGFYLEQFGGQSIVHDKKYQYDRKKGIDTETGEVIPLVDRAGNIKMNVEGPDVVKLEDTKIPEEIKNWLNSEQWATREIGARSQNISSYDHLDMVAVLYIYVKNPCSLKQVLKEGKGKGGKGNKPLMSVPIGNAMKSQCGRYV
jgi:hypothetical protein